MDDQKRIASDSPQAYKKRPSGKLDTQLFPECKGSKFDRDVVGKHRKRMGGK